MGTEEEIAVVEGLIAPVHEDLEGEELARGLGHLELAEVEELAVDPVVDPFLPGGAFGLGYLVRMVDGYMVRAARVDVEVLPEVLHAHGRALDVPARVAPAPGRVPGEGLVLELALGEPEGEIRGVALVRVHLDAGAGLEVVELEQGQVPVVREPRDVEVEVATRGIGVAIGLDAPDEGDHVIDMAGGRGRRYRGRTMLRRFSSAKKASV